MAVGPLSTFETASIVNLSEDSVNCQVFREWQCGTIMGFLDATGNVMIAKLLTW